jgi:hypothetical protein
MWRNIGAVIVGYIAMAAFVFVSFSVAYVVMGTDGAFKPASYDVSTLWIVASLVLGFIAAVLGGLVCAAIARGSKAFVWLAGIVLVLGLLMAVPALTTPREDPPPTRDVSVATFDAMSKAKQPGWVALANPFVGLVGVLLGGRPRGRSPEPETSPQP